MIIIAADPYAKIGRRPRRISVGVLPYRLTQDGYEVLLVANHGRGWFNGWELSKGHAKEGEDLQETARREFEEETGLQAPGALEPLGMTWDWQFGGGEGDKLVVMFATDMSSGSQDPNTNAPNEEGIREVGAAQWIPIDQAVVGVSAGNTYETPFVKKLQGILKAKEGYKPAEAKYPMPDPKKPWLSYPERKHPHADEPRPNRPTPEQLAEMEFHPAYEESGSSPASYRDFY